MLLDFAIENQTGVDMWVAGFIYQREGAENIWSFDKTNIIDLPHGQTGIIDVDTIVAPDDRQSVSGYLGLFRQLDDKQEDLKRAQKATFESLTPDQKIYLGNLINIQNKKVILIPKKYGVLAGFDDRHPHTEFILGSESNKK